MTDAEFLEAMGTDAVKWADAFCRRYGGDMGLMTSWFANAIEQGRSAGLRVAKREKEEAMQIGDRVQMGMKTGTVAEMDGEAISVQWDGEELNEIVDIANLTKVERGPNQTVSPGLIREEQRFTGTREEDEE